MRPTALFNPAATPLPPQPDRWARAGVEPTVEELMEDTLTALVMRRDRLRAEDVMGAVTAARRALAAAAQAAPDALPVPTPRPTPAAANAVRWIDCAVTPFPVARARPSAMPLPSTRNGLAGAL